MGAVYKAEDLILGGLVALKMIRQDLVRRPEIYERFLKEVKLAKEVTHINVVRIFELHTQSQPFITMAFIDGEDLHSLIQRSGPLPPGEATSIMIEICRGLEAIHQKKIIHRDLKPKNIMLDRSGHVCVTDFGIARSVEGDGATRVGAIIGTVRYMSPEQRRGDAVDARSDIYPLGLILQEMLDGRAFRAPLTHPPKLLTQIVDKCLKDDPATRYQTVTAVLKDLEEANRRKNWTWLWVAAAILVLILVCIESWRRIPSGPPPRKQNRLTLLLADLNNQTGETVLDGTFEPLLTVALESAPFLGSLPRNQAIKDAAQLRPHSKKIDQSLAKLIARRKGVEVVITGTLKKTGSRYTVSLKAIDPTNDRMMASAEGSARDKQALLAQVPALAESLRKGLGDTTPESTQVAQRETFSTGSVEAAHSYALGQEAQLLGKYEEALKHYEKAIQQDANMARAYAGAGTMSFNLGLTSQADNYWYKAMRLRDRMTDREKYRTWGNYYVSMGNYDKAIEEYSGLAKQFPSDTAGQANLAVAYFLKFDFARALIEGKRAVDISPDALNQRTNYAFYALYVGDFASAAEQARAVIKSNPQFSKPYVALALTELAEERLDAALKTYRDLQKNIPYALDDAAFGSADVLFCQGKLQEAIKMLEKTVHPEVKGSAYREARMSRLYSVSGDRARALASAEHADSMSDRRELGAKVEAATTFLENGKEARAHMVARTLAERFELESQILGKLIEAKIARSHGSARQAVSFAQDAQKLADTWLGHLELGLAYLAAKRYPEAESEFEKCIARRGEAVAVFLDDRPSYHYVAPVYYYLGRAQEAYQNPGAAATYSRFLAIKISLEDPMVSDCRRRLAALKSGDNDGR